MARISSDIGAQIRHQVRPIHQHQHASSSVGKDCETTKGRYLNSAETIETEQLRLELLLRGPQVQVRVSSPKSYT